MKRDRDYADVEGTPPTQKARASTPVFFDLTQDDIATETPQHDFLISPVQRPVVVGHIDLTQDSQQDEQPGTRGFALNASAQQRIPSYPDINYDEYDDDEYEDEDCADADGNPEEEDEQEEEECKMKYPLSPGMAMKRVRVRMRMMKDMTISMMRDMMMTTIPLHTMSGMSLWTRSRFRVSQLQHDMDALLQRP